MTDTIRAMLWMSGAIVSFSSMAVAGRMISFELDTFEIMMYRSFAGVLVVLVLARAFGTLGEVKTDKIRLHFLRNICHFAGQNLWFFAITVSPLAVVFALEFTTPLWVLLLSPLLLSERLTLWGVVGAALGFLGILLVARPATDSIDIGIITAALSAIGFAGSIISTKILTRTQTITCILFWLTVMQAVFGIICAGYDGDIAVPSASSLPWLILIGCAGLTAHFCLTTALKLAPATIVIPVDFLRLPLIALIGAAFYNEPLDSWVLAGACLIFGGNYLNVAKSTKSTQSS